MNNPQEALRGASVCFIFTDWDDIKALEPDVYKWLILTPLVYDGRNIYDLDEMRDAGVEYHSIGRICMQDELASLGITNESVSSRRKRLYREKSIMYTNEAGSYGNISV